tara:strand:+ start:567 stop:1604 length:1038 start_codon:yes stop_codon:yes gene_type:complete
MILYLIVFHLPLLLIYFEIKKKLIFKDFINLYFLFLIIFVGFRYEVGGDFYSSSMSMLPLLNLKDIFSTLTILNSLLLYISKISGLDIFLYNIIAAILFFLCFYKFIEKFEYKAHNFLIAFPVIFIILAMGFTKQSIAFSFILIGLLYYKNNNYLNTIIYFIIATLFHMSSLIIFIIFIYKIKIILRKYLLIIIPFFIFAFYLYYEVFVVYYNIWMVYDARPTSVGALFRCLINIPPIIIYLFIRKKILEKNLNYKFLDIIIIIQIIFIFLALLTNLSGLVDRMNILLSFTHIIIYSLAFEIIKKYYLEIFIFIYFKYLTILIVWLFLSDNSFAWLPYKNILFIP